MRGSIVCIAAVALASGSAGVAQGQALWRQPVSLGTSSSTSYTGALAAGDGGRLLVAWTPADTGTLRESVRFRLRPNATAPFTPVKQIVPPCPTAQCGTTAFKVAMNPAGQAIVVWRRQDTTTHVLTTFAVTIDPSGTAGSPQVVDTQTLTATVPTGGFALGVDSTGRVFLVAGDASGRPTVRIRSIAGSWSGPTLLAAAPMTQAGLRRPDPVIAVSGGHVAVAVALDGCAVQISRLGVSDTWTSDAPDDEAGCDHNPGVTISADGTVDAIWKTWRGTGFVVKAASAAPGTSFGTPAVLGDGLPGTWDASPTLRRLADGRVVAVWTDYNSAVADVRVRTSGTWGPISRMPTGRMAIDRNGTVIADRVHGVGRMGIGQLPVSRVLRPTSEGVEDLAVFPNGELAKMIRDRATAQLLLVEFTTRPLPRLVISPTPYPVGLQTRARFPAGAILPLVVGLSRDWDGMPVPLRVQQLRSGRWVTIASRTVVASGQGAIVHVRVRTVGTTRLRVMAAGSARVSRSVTVELRKVRYRRNAVGVESREVLAAQSGLWINERGALRRLDPASGATIRLHAHPGVWFSDWRQLTPDGPSALLVKDGAGNRLARFDTASGARTTRRMDRADNLSASSDGHHLWVSGICPSSFPNVADGLCRDTTMIAKQLDPVTLAPTGVTATHPTIGFEVQWVIGSRVWFGGTDPNDFDHRMLFAANAATGVIDPASQLDIGRFDGSFYPLTDTVVWAAGYHGAKRLAPGPAAAIAITPGYRFQDLARSGTTVWMMQRRSLPTIGMYDLRLVQYRLDGTLTGQVVQLGETSSYAARLSIRNNVAWILNLGEAAVLRVPLP